MDASKHSNKLNLIKICLIFRIDCEVRYFPSLCIFQLLVLLLETQKGVQVLSSTTLDSGALFNPIPTKKCIFIYKVIYNHSSHIPNLSVESDIIHTGIFSALPCQDPHFTIHSKEPEIENVILREMRTQKYAVPDVLI